MTFITETVIPHLRTQFEKALPILFTGAGFSLPAKNVMGLPVPGPRELAQIIWPVAFPSEEFDTESALRDVYAAALNRRSRKLEEVLVAHFTVTGDSLKEWMAVVFSQPWHRIYTLNIDTLPSAIEERYNLPRQLVQISAAGSSSRPRQEFSQSRLEVVHLNGMLDDVPDGVTFSETQYAERLASPDDALYRQLTADLLTRPVVFIGTRLEESTLWQSVQRRRMKGQRGTRELRPRSYLVCPELDRAREARLEAFNIVWLKLTAQEFSQKILEELRPATERGLTYIRNNLRVHSKDSRLSDVAELATSPSQTSDFLRGAQPIWADIQSSRAILRECDETFRRKMNKRLSRTVPGVFVLTGTAGSGKTTALMRLALQASAEGKRVAWIDADSELTPSALHAAMRQTDAPDIVAIDAAEGYGRGLATMIRDVVQLDSAPLVLVSVRSGRVDAVLNRVVLGDVPVEEVTVPHLADSDIDALIDVLEQEHLLGALRGRSRPEQRRVFAEHAGRQLLVAMISARSGRRFEEKISNEYDELGDDARLLYATVSLGTHFSYSLQRQEILIAINDASNTQLNVIEDLLRRHILVERPPGSGRIQTRHRVIADHLWRTLQQRGELADIVNGIGLLAATLPVHAQKRSRARRLLLGVTNHEFLHRAIGLERSKMFYEQLERVLYSNFHYWLQRGSLEIEFGDLELAEEYLSQARSMEPSDFRVENAWAYLLCRQAINRPRAEGSHHLMEDATSILETLISSSYASPHPFHVLGSQGLSWSRYAPLSWNQKEELLNKLKSQVIEGIRRFPKEEKLKKLASDLQKEYLQLAVRRGQ